MSTWWIEDLGSCVGTRVNGTRVEGLTSLRPGDLIQTGKTCLIVIFTVAPDSGEAGFVEHGLISEETIPPAQVSEDQQLEILVRFSDIAAHSRSSQAMLEGFLRELRAAFPSAQRQTLIMIEDRELVARAFYPHDRAGFSFTLARKAIQSLRAIEWRSTDRLHNSASLEGVLCALYAPMLRGGEAVGVVHVDNGAEPVEFTRRDLSVLVVVASTIAGALRAGKKDLLPYPSVFLSYAHKDRELADRLVSELRRRRVKVWFDERLRVGRAWLAQLEMAIRKVDAIILLVSPSSIASRDVKWELETAKRHRIRILPVIGHSCEMPSDLRHLQHVALVSPERAASTLADELHERIRRKVIR